MTEIWDRVRTEPVMVLALVEAVIGLVVVFGVDLTTEQSAAILTVTGALLALVARQAVAPAQHSR